MLSPTVLANKEKKSIGSNVLKWSNEQMELL